MDGNIGTKRSASWSIARKVTEVFRLKAWVCERRGCRNSQVDVSNDAEAEMIFCCALDMLPTFIVTNS